ncbi:MAG: hypothetical protein EA378_04390 [Phycisphaerales bacterium]|nr:MAG: hypothetical protein EA378_04390 [Phycisphaerales bacterium]
MLGVPPPGPPSEPALPPEARLWRALAQGEDAFDPYALIAHGEGALLPGTHDGAIEVWTEGELAALHALDRFARRQDSAGLRERIASAVRWHLAEIQPDNATNRPWAIHVFVRAGVVDGAIEALMHAQTMLHNCRVSLGHADRFSACLLEDAARALEEDEGVRRG